MKLFHLIRSFFAPTARLASVHLNFPNLTGCNMDTLPLPNDAVATGTVGAVDQVKRTIAPPAGGTVSVADPTVASASLSTDGTTVTVTPVGNGTTTVTYANGSFTDQVTVVVADPTVSAIALGGWTYAAKP